MAPPNHKTGSFLLADLRRSYHNGTLANRAVISDLPEQDRPTPPMTGIGEFPRYVLFGYARLQEMTMRYCASGRWGNVVVDVFTPGIIDEIQKQANVGVFCICVPK